MNSEYDHSIDYVLRTKKKVLFTRICNNFGVQNDNWKKYIVWHYGVTLPCVRVFCTERAIFRESILPWCVRNCGGEFVLKLWESGLFQEIKFEWSVTFWAVQNASPFGDVLDVGEDCRVEWFLKHNRRRMNELRKVWWK